MGVSKQGKKPKGTAAHFSLNNIKSIGQNMKNGGNYYDKTYTLLFKKYKCVQSLL